MTQKQYKPFLDSAIKNIQKALDENYLSIFAGAGVSVNSNLPNWSELIQKITEELYGETNGNDKDSLVLAEKFYNQFKSNHYYETLKKYIPDSAIPNDIHKKIVKMNINNLITTNWDNLFEQAISDEGQFFNIIKKDDDMGYVTGFSKLIKMHGDLNERNIVFREKDYLEYSDNFPLIENYIKGIFSTNLVIMLGYSLSDNNVKQIISWINYHSKDIKPIYFVDLGKDFDGLEFDFYKHKNIYVLYLNHLFPNEKNKGNKLEQFLDLMESNEKPIDINKLESQQINLLFNNFLDKFNNCQFVIQELFIRDIKRRFKLSAYDISYSPSVISITNKIMENIDETIYQKIANLTRTPIYTKNKYITPDFYESNNDLLNALLNFDFKYIETKIKKLSLKDISDNEELKKAFLLYQNEQYLESCETLKRVSKNAFKNRNYSIWYIAETNKKHFIFKNVTKDIEEQVKEYFQEIDKEDLEEKYLKLPKKQRFELQYIKNIELYIANNFLKIYELRDKITQDYYRHKNGGFSMNHNIENLTNIIYKIIRFELDDYLMVDLSELYKNATEGLLIYEALCGLKQEIQTGQINNENAKDKTIRIKIDKMLFYFVLKYFSKAQDLITMLKDYFKKEYIFIFDDESLHTIFKNICDKFIKNGAFQTYYSQLFNNFLIFSAWIELSQANFDIIIKEIENKLHNRLLGIPQYDAINYFLVYQYNKNKYKANKICFDNIEKIICTYLEAFICGKFGGYDVMALQHSSAFPSMFIILERENIKFNPNTNQKIQLFIETIKDFDIDTKRYYYSNLLSKIEKLVDTKTHNKIIKIAKSIEQQ